MEVITRRGMILSQRYLHRASEALLVASKLENPAMRKDAMEIVDLYLQVAAEELEWTRAEITPRWELFVQVPEVA